MKYSRCRMHWIVAVAVSCGAGALGTARAGEQILVTVDPGTENLPPWMAQQRLEVSGAMELLGREGKPHPDSVEVWECDGEGTPKGRVPSQFDVESRDPLIGIVSWRTEKADAGKPHRYQIRWSDAPAAPAEGPASPLAVEQRDGLCIVSNTGYRVVHDPGRGGIAPLVTYSVGKDGLRVDLAGRGGRVRAAVRLRRGGGGEDGGPLAGGGRGQGPVSQ